MNQITVLLQNGIKNLMNTLSVMYKESKDIFEAYWKTDANVKIGGLSSDDDPATVGTKFTKKNYIDGISFCENVYKFFNNQAITQADYLQTIGHCRYGNAELINQLSVATEEIGKRIKDLCLNALEICKNSIDILNIYNDNEVSDVVGVLDDERIIYGSEMTKSDLNLAVTLLQQYLNLLMNNTVITGDYSSTIAKWRRLTEL